MSEHLPSQPRNWLGYCGCYTMGCLSLPLLFVILAIIGVMLGKSQFTPSSTASPYDKEVLYGAADAPRQIAVIDIEGVIYSAGNSSLSSSGAVSEEICRQLEYVAGDPAIAAVILRVNTPGGEVVAADNIYHEILRLKQTCPVVASMGAMATSGGYYVSAPCSKIIAHELTITGSIGVIMSSFKYYELLDKIGLAQENYTSGNLKDILSGVRPTSPEEKAIIQSHIDLVYSRFVQIVADSRPDLTVDKIKNSIIGDGRILSAPQALELGLIDELGYFDAAIAAAAKLADLGENDYSVVAIKRNLTVGEALRSLTNFTADTPVINVNLPGASASSQNQPLPSGRFYFLPSGQ